MHFSQGTLRHVRIRERTGPSQGVTQHSEPHEGGPMLQNLRRGLRKKHCNKNDAPAEIHGLLRKSVHKVKEKDKATFYSLSEV